MDFFSRLLIVAGAVLTILFITSYNHKSVFLEDPADIEDMNIWPNIRPNKTIIVITPTRQKAERMADLTMLAQTLRQVNDLFWIVVEDDNHTKPIVERLLQRSGINYTYLYTYHQNLPCRGWAHRNKALEWLEENLDQFHKGDLIYFADDDNSYDLRLFDEYIRKVKILGVWAVGTPGNILVESPIVQDGLVVGWNSWYRPWRNYAIDMAGFALKLDIVMRKKPRFDLRCAGTKPEDCFLTQLKIPRSLMEPFGWDHIPKEVLVYHRKTAKALDLPGDLNGYEVEGNIATDRVCDALMNIDEMSKGRAMLTAMKYGRREYDEPT